MTYYLGVVEGELHINIANTKITSLHTISFLNATILTLLNDRLNIFPLFFLRLNCPIFFGTFIADLIAQELQHLNLKSFSSTANNIGLNKKQPTFGVAHDGG